MYKTINDRVVDYACYIIDNKCTIRACAKHFNTAKSSVHYDLKYRLPKISLTSFLAVKAILDQNFQEKHIRGGEATRIHYLNKKQTSL